MISSFMGEWRFLSNFWEVVIQFDGEFYNSVEHAYQALKTLDINERMRIQKCVTPGEAKLVGKTLTLRSDWDEVKLGLMEKLLRQKFAPGLLITDRLCQTYPRILIEGNYWGDTFWGMCNGVGENHLGKLLMKIRNEMHVRHEDL
jgi:ribA/ribD-fused uncharacterized protein